MKKLFVGWCHEGGHDKVWSLIQLDDNNFVTIWGRRGAKLSAKVKQFRYQTELYKIIDSKKAKGYIEIDQNKLNEVYPEFDFDLNRMAFWSAFKTQ